MAGARRAERGGAKRAGAKTLRLGVVGKKVRRGRAFGTAAFGGEPAGAPGRAEINRRRGVVQGGAVLCANEGDFGPAQILGLAPQRAFWRHNGFWRILATVPWGRPKNLKGLLGAPPSGTGTPF